MNGDFVGSNKSVSMFSDLILDRTPSFDEDTTNTSHLEYSWSCTQLFPLLLEHCEGVDASSLPSCFIRSRVFTNFY
jgi:hypothetical protein